MSALPIPSAQSAARSAALSRIIAQNIQAAGGWISFASFMQIALYYPQLGYYSGGAQKFGPGGDFVTSPELGPLFAQTLAQQVAQVLATTSGELLELGAGSGQLAADLLLSLADLAQLPTRYCILEVSDYLRQIQYETLKNKLPATLFARVVWLESLPSAFVGVVLANEVLDAVPPQLVCQQCDGLYERGISGDASFIWQDRPLTSGPLYAAAQALNLPQGYLTEINLAAAALVRSLADSLQRGVIFLIDYGFNAAEYYHPQRHQGTLMCHYQQYAHDDPLINIGLQDITAHVNFSAMAQAGVARGLTLQGYANQAHFLVNCGVLTCLGQLPADDVARYVPMASTAQKLLSPAEMGELFKVLALSRSIEIACMGFSNGDKSHTL